jgi:glucokinase
MVDSFLTPLAEMVVSLNHETLRSSRQLNFHCLAKKRFPGSIPKKGGVPVILAGDIGGTNARLGLFAGAGDFRVIAEAKYPTREASGLEELILRFFEQQKIGSKSKTPNHPQHGIVSACFSMAGPIREGRCQMTNVPWIVDGPKLSKTLAIPKISLINDIAAHAHGLHLLQAKDLAVLQPGLQQMGNQAMVFAGTGLGEAGVFWNGLQCHPLAGEGGHVDFAPRNELEIKLFLHLQKKYGHVSYERIVSGPGLYEVYQFLIESNLAPASAEVELSMQKMNPSLVITKVGKTGTDIACTKALDLFLSIYGAECGNVALKFLSLGGLYIGGGVITHLAEAVQKSSFLSSFCDKGRFKTLLQSIPVSIVLTGKTALLGAAMVARNSL